MSNLAVCHHKPPADRPGLLLASWLTLALSAVALCVGSSADAVTLPPVGCCGDGTRIVTAADLSEGYGVYIFDTEGRSCSFIPFGHQIIAIKWPLAEGPIGLLAKYTDGKYYIWIANSSGIISRLSTRPVYVHDTESADLFSWSPDCRYVVFPSTANGRTSLWKVNVEQGYEQRLTESRGRDFEPAWSPNGRWLAFTSDRSGTLGLYRVPAAGGSVQKIIDGLTNERHADWLPDSQRIVFLSSGARTSVCQVGITDRKVLPLATGGKDYSLPILSDTGRWLAFTYGSTPSNLFAAPLAKTRGWGPYYQISFDRGEGVSTTLKSADWVPGRDQLVFATYEGGRLSLRIASLSEKLGPVLKSVYTGPAAKLKRTTSPQMRQNPPRRRT